MKTVKETFKIVGIKTRTINAPGKADKDIPALWNRFMGEGIAHMIPNKVGDEIYCVYANYDGDHTQYYDTILGCRVSTLEDIPDGMEGLTIEGGNYEKFTAKGNLMQGTIIVEKWMEIWNSNMPRAYKADYEVYDERTVDPENAEVDIFVSLQ